MNWLQKIADQIEFDQTLNVLSQYFQKLPGEWTMTQASRLDEGEMNLGYKGTGVKKPFDEYQITVWFMHDPNKTPIYDQNIGHHSIKFGCLVLVLEDERLERIGDSPPELDTPKSVVDYVWKTIENHGWGGDEQSDTPVAPITPEFTSPDIAPSGVSNPQLQLV